MFNSFHELIQLSQKLAALTFLRITACIAFALRSYLESGTDLFHKEINSQPLLRIWIVLILTNLTWTLSSTSYIIINLRKSRERREQVLLGQAPAISSGIAFYISLIDLVFYLGFYLATIHPESDLFLFLLTPVATAVLFSPHHDALTIAIISCLGLLTVLIWMHALIPDFNPEIADKYAGIAGLERIIIRIFSIRAACLFVFAITLGSSAQAQSNANGLLQSVLSHLHIVIWRKDLKGKFTFVNAEFVKIANKPVTQILGHTDNEVFKECPAEIIEGFKKGDAEVIKMCRDRNDYKMIEIIFPNEPFPLANGDIQYNYVKKVPLIDTANKLIGTQGFFLNVENKSTPMKDAVILSVVATHSENLNHELRNQLAEIGGCCESIKGNLEEFQRSELRDSTKLQTSLSFAKLIAENVTSMRLRLEDLGRVRSKITEFKVVALNNILRAQFHKHRGSLAKYIQKVNAPKNAIYVSVDEALLSSALRNMFLNAKEAIELALEQSEKTIKPKLEINLVIRNKFIPAINSQGDVACIEIVNTSNLTQAAVDAINRGEHFTTKEGKGKTHGFGIRVIREFARLHDAHFEMQLDSHNLLVCSVLQIQIKKG